MKPRRLIVALFLLLALGGSVPQVAAAQGRVAPTTTLLTQPPPVWAIQFAQRMLEARESGKTELKLPFWIRTPINIFITISYLILSLVMSIAGLFYYFAGKFLDIIFSVENYASVQFVIDGWKMVRNTLNLVFIFVLLAVAFATISGFENYEARRMLPRVIIAALLVNFSLAIGGAINGVATCVMNQSMAQLAKTSQGPIANTPQNEDKGVCGGGADLGTRLTTSLANGAAVGKYFTYGPSILADIFTGGTIHLALGERPSTFGLSRPFLNELLTTKSLDKAFANWAGAHIAVFFVFLLFAAFLALLVLFFMRTVVLLILLILSPIPFVLGVIPQLAGYARMWWEQFLKYVMFGPITILLLVVLANAMNITKTPNNPKALPPGTALIAQLAPNLQGGPLLNLVGKELVGTAFSTAVITTLIIMVILIGLKLGLVGAQGAVGFGRAVASAPGRALWSRTGAPFVAGFQRVREDIAKERGRGRLAQLGARFGATLQPRAAVSVQKRMEDEAVKDLAARNVPLAKLNLANRADARYALDKDLVREAKDYRTALGALESGTPEYAKGVKSFQERFVIAGTNYANKAATAKDYAKALRGLSPTKAYEAFVGEEKEFLDKFEKDPAFDITENLARGIVNANDKNAARAIETAYLKGKQANIPKRADELFKRV